MTLRKQIEQIYCEFKETYPDLQIMTGSYMDTVEANGTIVYLADDGTPFQFDNSADIMIFCNPLEWSRTSEASFKSYGDVPLSFSIAYKKTINIEKIANFVYFLKCNDGYIDRVDRNTAEILQRDWFRSNDKFPLNYNAINIELTFKNVELKDFL